MKLAHKPWLHILPNALQPQSLQLIEQFFPLLCQHVRFVILVQSGRSFQLGTFLQVLVLRNRHHMVD